MVNSIVPKLPLSPVPLLSLPLLRLRSLLAEAPPEMLAEAAEAAEPAEPLSPASGAG